MNKFLGPFYTVLVLLLTATTFAAKSETLTCSANKGNDFVCEDEAQTPFKPFNCSPGQLGVVICKPDIAGTANLGDGTPRYGRHVFIEGKMSPIAPEDFPSANDRDTLKNCKSEYYYYGLGGIAKDYTKM